MKRAPRIAATLALLAAAGAATAQQVSGAPPAQGATPPQQQKKEQQPALNLRLNDLDRRPVVRFTPKEEEKKDPAHGLPGLGGDASKTAAQPPPPDKVIPITNDNIE